VTGSVAQPEALAIIENLDVIENLDGLQCIRRTVRVVAAPDRPGPATVTGGRPADLVCRNDLS
jgi:hypothetical protein